MGSRVGGLIKKAKCRIARGHKSSSCVFLWRDGDYLAITSGIQSKNNRTISSDPQVRYREINFSGIEGTSTFALDPPSNETKTNGAHKSWTIS